MNEETREEAQAKATSQADELVKSLINARVEQGISQSRLAEKMGVQKQVISRNEARGGGGNMVNFIEWAAALGYDVVLVPKK